MNIKHSIGLNLSADAIPGRLHMVQGDANSRTIVATLWDGAQLYSIPAGAAVMVRFRKPDDTGGLYDATESGSEVSYAGSIVTAPVATQMLAVAGDVFAEIDIFGSSSGAAAERLATFRFVVEVAPCVLPDAKIISSDYYNILASKVAEAIAAAERAEQAQSAAAASAEAAATSAANAATSVEGAVKYNTAQTLTDEQKQQARDNINAPAPYTAGENISISGSVIATKAFPCNPNLLDNWYFGNPVNQRGQTSYTGVGYGIDRWKIGSNGTLTIQNGYITFSSNDETSRNLEEYLEALPVGAYILSAIVENGAGATLIVGANGTYYNANISDDSKQVVSVMFVKTTTGPVTVYLQCPNKAVSWFAVKLELGSVQTLAHQENGVWVLNEIPKFGDQLAECQRYYYRLNSHAYGWTYNNSIANCLIPLPVTLRTTPVLTIHASGTINTVAGDAAMASYELKGLQSNGLIIDLHNAENAFTLGTPVVWHNFDIDISADL